MLQKLKLLDKMQNIVIQIKMCKWFNSFLYSLLLYHQIQYTNIKIQTDL